MAFQTQVEKYHGSTAKRWFSMYRTMYMARRSMTKRFSSSAKTASSSDKRCGPRSHRRCRGPGAQARYDWFYPIIATRLLPCASASLLRHAAGSDRRGG